MTTEPDILSACLNFIHSVQNERGLATLYLCSRSERGKDDLANQFILTDIAIEKIQADALESAHPFTTLLPILEQVTRQRNDIALFAARIGDVVAWYTEALIQPALDSLADSVLHDNRYSPVRASAFIYLLQWQEQLSHEREMITQLAGQEWLHDEAFVSRLKKIIRERQTYERLFWGVSDNTQHQACLPLKKGSADSPAATGTDGLKTQDKFSFFCSKISALHEASKKVAAQLIDESLEQAPPSPSGQALDTEVEGHYDIIRALPLFRGLKNDVLHEILRPARLVHHDKGSLFLTQGETATRLYVILDGWVKTYKSTDEGDEAIVQLLGKRECVAECDLYPASSCPISARSITKIKLLSLPASLFRDQLVQHKELALNLIAVSSRRMQRLISHIEQLTLRSAKQRLGSFLLNINLDTGIGGPPFTLPFDKSLIAAYLNIKPETFSRLLQSFRNQGFAIERSQVTLPEPYALCPYCDSDTAQKCDLADTATCPRAEFCMIKFG